jgi:hypothetical protein
MNKNFHLRKEFPNKKTIFIFWVICWEPRMDKQTPNLGSLQKIKNKMTSFNKNSHLKQNKKEKGSRD